jgi:hypothetical protein
MTQTRLQSLIEVIASTTVGYGVAVLTQIAVFPLRSRILKTHRLR